MTDPQDTTARDTDANENSSDQAILPGTPFGMGSANTFSGALSFLRRR